jgi:hypothetical protein
MASQEGFGCMELIIKIDFSYKFLAVYHLEIKPIRLSSLTGV